MKMKDMKITFSVKCGNSCIYAEKNSQKMLECNIYNGEIIKEVVDFKEIEPKVYSFTLVGYNFTTENCTLYTNIGDFSMNCTPSMSENLVRLSEKIWPLYVFVGFAVVVIVIIVVTVAKSKNNKNSVK